ncbi:Leucine aminopeptidase 1 [Quaeritorhiza haematococci]|nr:Leucine aminopeptidase 1 [Quaeritorhiza haematococci]
MLATCIRQGIVVLFIALIGGAWVAEACAGSLSRRSNVPTNALYRRQQGTGRGNSNKNKNRNKGTNGNKGRGGRVATAAAPAGLNMTLAESVTGNLNVDRMVQFLETFVGSFNTRFAFSDDGVRASDFLAQQLRTITNGRDDITVEQVAITPDVSPALANLQKNVVVRFAGSVNANGPLTILGAHMDSINMPRRPGDEKAAADKEGNRPFPFNGQQPPDCPLSPGAVIETFADFRDCFFGDFPDLPNEFVEAVRDLPAPGADDDASGVAISVETLRALVDSGFRPNNPLEFHFYAAEEVGLKGSRSISRAMKAAGTPVRAMLQLDMEGAIQGGGIATVNVENAAGTALKDELFGLAPVFAQSLRMIQDSCGDIDCSDQMAFVRDGFPAAYIFGMEDLPSKYSVLLVFSFGNDLAAWLTSNSTLFYQPADFYHTPDDTVEVMLAQPGARTHLGDIARLATTFLLLKDGQAN